MSLEITKWYTYFRIRHEIILINILKWEFLKFIFHKEYITQEDSCRLNVISVDFVPPELLLFVVSACLSVARKPFARCCNCAISCREKKKRHVPFAIFLSERHWPVTCFEAYAYTSRFEPCDMWACSAETKRGFAQDEWLYQSISCFDNYG